VQSEKINRKLRAFDPSLQNMTSIENMLKVLILYYLCLLPFFHLPECVYGVPFLDISYETIRDEATFKSFPDFIVAILAFFFQGKPPNILLAPAMYTHLRARGMAIFVLGVETPEDIKNALYIGATAVLTDKPSSLVKYVRDNNIIFKKVQTHKS
jgi:hypothetical protein